VKVWWNRRRRYGSSSTPLCWWVVRGVSWFAIVGESKTRRWRPEEERTFFQRNRKRKTSVVSRISISPGSVAWMYKLNCGIEMASVVNTARLPYPVLRERCNADENGRETDLTGSAGLAGLCHGNHAACWRHPDLRG
jgi:hypothetical protein